MVTIEPSTHRWSFSSDRPPPRYSQSHIKLNTYKSGIRNPAVSSKSLIFEITKSGRVIQPKVDLTAPKKKTKPWVKDAKVEASESITRVKLAPVQLEDDIHYKPLIPGRLTVRIERLMQSNQVRITDPMYLSTLAHGMRIEENARVKQRMKEREFGEVQRERQLALDGWMLPSEENKDLYNHPTFRANSILRQLNRQHSHRTPETVPVMPEIPLAKIETSDPFDEYEKTGVLFGKHRNHYTRVHPLQPIVAERESRISLYPSKFVFDPTARRTTLKKGLLALAGRTDQAFSVTSYTSEPLLSPSFTGQISSKMSRGASEVIVSPSKVTKQHSENEYKTDEQTEEESDTDYFDGTPPSSGRISLKKDLRSLLLRRDLKSTAKFLGLDAADLEKQWKARRNKLIDDLYNEKEGEDADDLYDFSNEISWAFKRQNVKGDAFCNKTLRKLLATA